MGATKDGTCKELAEQPGSQISRVDRFIASRDVISDVRRRRPRSNSCSREDVDIWFTKYQQKKKYMSYLDEAFGLEPPSSPAMLTQGLERVWTWPCLPRTRSHLASADSVLDLPSYSDAPFPELLDWSNDNILVAALENKYHKWSWGSQSLISQGLARDRILCCKFDPKGELLALGTEMQGIEVHDNLRSKRIGNTTCVCFEVKAYYCAITALDWSPTGNSLVTGCCSGVVMSSTRNLRLISWRQLQRDEPVLAARVSPDARFVAATFVNCPRVMLLGWPELETLSCLELDSWIVKTLTWHPWRSALLGVGAITKDRRAQVSLWDAPTAKTRDITIGRTENHLDSMLFSHRTGELVLSTWYTEPASILLGTWSQLVVMSDPDTVVDRWGEGRSWLDRVRTMVFSPDGTKLATATSGEDLIIWNFLPEEKKKKKKRECKRFSAIPVYLDETSYGHSIR